MGGGAVAFVSVPAVLREFQVNAMHVLVAVCFGQDAGGGDGGEFAVSFDHTFVYDLRIGFESVAVDQ